MLWRNLSCFHTDVCNLQTMLSRTLNKLTRVLTIMAQTMAARAGPAHRSMLRQMDGTSTMRQQRSKSSA